MKLRDLRADGSTGEWFETYGALTPIGSYHPPSLRNPQKVKQTTAQDGWKKGDSKASRQQAMRDLVEIHKRLRRQFGKPEIAQGANYPLYPSIAQTF